MRKTLRYRLYRSKRDKHLVRQIELAGEVWNHFVALTRRYYALYGTYPGYFCLKRHLAKLKGRDKKHWYGLGSQALQNVIERLDKSYQRCFSDPKTGRPGFKKRCKYPSFTLTQAGWKYLGGNRLRIGSHTYKFVLSRPLEGDMKTVTIKRDNCGDLWVCFSVVQDVQRDGHPSQSMPQTGSAVGVDFGLKTFLTCSDGQTVESPQHLRAALRRMATLQRAVSRKQRGSINRRKAVRRVARLHRRIAGQRRDFHFKVGRALLERHDTVCMEDLNLDDMKRRAGNRRWGRKVSDLGYYQFVGIVEYLASTNGKRVLRVERFYASSKTCNVCGEVHAGLTLADRTWTCQGCQTQHDRDHNAAKNIRDRALSRSVGDVSREFHAIAVAP